ncbi:MAG: biotin synthase [Prevotella bivia]|nr:biotin synthase [Prevotella bivia]
MKACFQIAECRLSSTKIVPASAMKACFQIAERRLSSTKIVPASAMKACFQIAERRLSSTKIGIYHYIINRVNRRKLPIYFGS